MKGSPVIQKALQRPGPAPHRSDSESITVALSQEVSGEPREDHVFRVHHASVQTFFPRRNERSRSTRRKRDLWSVILAVRVSVQIVLDALEWEETAVSDSAPIPCLGDTRAKRQSDVLGTADDGVWSSKALKDVGCTLHRVVSLTGVIMGFVLTSARPSDTQPVVELLDAFSHHRTRVLGDGASNDADLQRFLEQDRALKVLAPVPVKQAGQRSRSAHRQRTSVRVICETVHAQVHEQVHVSTHAAQRTQGFLTRRAANVTAQSVGMMVNVLLGRPMLKVAALAVSQRAQSVSVILRAL